MGSALMLILGALYGTWPRHADLRRFDPARMARAETLMWRHYYEKRYWPLFAELYGTARDQQGFSPWDSLRLSFHAARAAYRFQPSRSRAEAEAALPDLVSYFRILATATPKPVDAADLARTELAWWQARRENVRPEDYGLILARVSSLLYGVDNDDVRASGVLRAEAMATRDARGAQIDDADWAKIAEDLDRSYRLLHRAIAR